MILHRLDELRARAVVLASQSPRRRELLAQLGATFTTAAPPFDEATLRPEDFPSVRAFCERSALCKARSVAAAHPGADLIIAADTVVALDGRVLGKPHTPARAAEFLTALSGRAHSVVSGVAVLAAGGREDVFSEETEVEFRALCPALVAAYAATPEPLDKAGGYAIQGAAGAMIAGIRGCYYNVMGLPLSRLAAALGAALDFLAARA
eukprot:gnl/Chilomastix_cuspidata/8143.p3 GENE.gnl/Chilomastix_cuspidata/8143~~gnl/Chilomastix_cuspidata/8143.p3  ORF type:complete len:208 (+),score=134.46 gnl/Chilomastix_cuspidata/8143:169-792(+)